MVFSKLIFIYLAIFPLGQIIRLRISVLGSSYPLHPVDIVAGLILLMFLLTQQRQPYFFRYILGFLIVSAFSLLLSLSLFTTKEILSGGFYFLRLAAYTSIIPVVWSINKSKINKKVLYNCLLMTTIAVAVFGWIQYLWLPDLRDLKYIGWDDHYFRMFGTFLDPAFFGLIIVFGALIALSRYISKNKKYILIVIFMLFTLLLSYSRASYLAFLAGLIALLYNSRKKLIYALVIIFALFAISLPFLPRNISEAAKLERTYSVFAKLHNWKETAVIIRKNPLFGVGYNNLCAARMKYLGLGSFDSHACSGSDSSLLFVLATTGISGFIMFVYMLFQISKRVQMDQYGRAFKACGAALLIHSLFVNSLFYSWILGFMGILLAISIKEKSGE